MSEKLTAKSCLEFVRILSSSAPVPGGGGAAALVGAIGMALGNMVGSLTVGKKKYASVEREILDLKARADTLQERLLAMVERDAEAFEPLSKAYAIPKDAPDRERVMEAALRAASAAPLEIMELCLAALPIIEQFAQIGSRLAVSDAGCAAVCCRAGLYAASLNVSINTKSMADRAFAETLNAQTEKMLAEGGALADRIFVFVQAQLV